MEHPIVLKSDALDSSDPHGYYQPFDSRNINVRSPSKRSFLRECIRQIYIIKGKSHLLPAVHGPVEFNGADIWQSINALLAPRHTDWRCTLQRVKRQLFREPKRRSRKLRVPLKRKQQLQTPLHFKPFRSRIGTRRVRRNYLDEARTIVTLQPAKPIASYITTADQQISTNIIADVCKNHKNMARPQLSMERTMAEQAARNRNTLACRLSRRARILEDLFVEEQYQQHLRMRDQVLQASLRSVYYMKALFSLLVDRERNLPV